MAEQIEDITNCPVCFEPFRDPKKLTCDHSLCAACFERIKTEKRIRCPKCNTFSYVTKVKPDFRLVQFLDAFTKLTENLIKTEENNEHVEPIEHEFGLCELCVKHCITHLCTDCEQKICTECKIIHLRTKLCQNHEVVYLVEEGKKAKDALEANSKLLKEKNAEFESAIKFLRDEPNEPEPFLKTSKEMREGLHSEIDNMFDSFDEKIKSAVIKGLEMNARQKMKYKLKQKEVHLLQNKVGTLLRVDILEMISGSKSLIPETKDYLENLCPVQKVSYIPAINLRKNKAFKLSKFASLEIVDAHEMQCSSNPCSASGGGDLDRKQQKIIEKWCESLPIARNLGVWQSYQIFTQEHWEKKVRDGLMDNNCPQFIIDRLTKSYKTGNTQTDVQAFLEKFGEVASEIAYFTRSIHVRDVMSCENDHIPEELLRDPGFVLIMD